MEPLTDLNIWALNETDNKWIKFNEEIDYEAFIALTALIKFRKFAYNIDFDPSGLETGTNTENTSEKPDKTEDSSEMNNADEPSVDNIYHLTRADFQKTLNMLCSFNWGFYYGQCPSKNCRRRGTSNGGVQVYCGQSHAHLRAHCANWTDHGLDFVLDAILAGSADTYETDKEVFGAYLDFVRDTMDKTPSDDEDVYSTPLPDYELSTEDLNRITEKSKILPNNSGFVQPPHCGVNH